MKTEQARYRGARESVPPVDAHDDAALEVLISLESLPLHLQKNPPGRGRLLFRQSLGCMLVDPLVAESQSETVFLVELLL